MVSEVIGPIAVPSYKRPNKALSQSSREINLYHVRDKSQRDPEPTEKEGEVVITNHFIYASQEPGKLGLGRKSASDSFRLLNPRD